MRVLVISPGRAPEVREIDGSLRSMQAIVGGLIQAVDPFDEPVALVCSEEGKLENLPMCRILEESHDIVHGTFFLCGAPPDSENFTSLTDDQIARYTHRFHYPEVFLPLDGHIFVLTER